MVTTDDIHPHDHLRIMGNTHPVWGERADLQIDVVIPGVDDSLERLVVRRIGDKAYEVCCLPFALYDLSLGDIVQVAELTHVTPGRIARVLQPSGRFLFRVIVLDGDLRRMRSLESTFASMGCLFEVYSAMMLAVDAADEPTRDFLVAVLEVLQSRGGLEYETVHAAS